ILLTEQPDARYVEPHTVRPRDRLRARVSTWKLDRALARGASPDSSTALSLRANQLIGRNVRRRLAQELRQLPSRAPSPLPAGGRCADLPAGGPPDRRATRG